MKKIFYILFLSLLSFSFSFGQETDNEEAAGKLRERFREYMQQRLGLSKKEADKFFPVCLRYFNEIKKTNEEYKGDKLVRQQKVIEVKLRFREQFRQTVSERLDRVDPDKVDKAAGEFRKIVTEEAGKRNLRLRRNEASKKIERIQ